MHKHLRKQKQSVMYFKIVAQILKFDTKYENQIKKKDES